MAEPLDPYKILQVDPEAEDEVIQAAYRRLAQKYHPDRASEAEGSTRMSAINGAWEMVRDPARRAAYDRSRREGIRRATAGGQTSAERRDAPAAEASRASGSPMPGDTGSTGPTAPRPFATRHAPGAPASGRQADRPPETVSSDWTSGRSTTGGGYDAATMGAAEGFGAAGPAPGNPSGPVMNFGRYAGWSLGEIARADLEYIEWLERMPIGRTYRVELDGILRRAGRRKSEPTEAAGRRGLFRRR